jgi:hypothetical protein
MRKKAVLKEEVEYSEVDLGEVTDMQSNLNEPGSGYLMREEENGLQQDSGSLAEVIIFDPIKEKIEEARVMANDLNLFISRTGKELAERAIRLGLVLIELKYLVKMSDEKWEEWADENLPFIGKRNRQKYMLLAKREDCHPFTPLGVDRLEMLCSATKNLDVENPIGSFLPKHEITVNETTELDVEEFKVQVDTALNKEKLEKRNIRINPEVIEAATREGKSFDKRLLNKLSNIAHEGGDPEAYLKNPSTVTEKKEESESPVKDKTKDFISLSNKLMQAVDDILNDPEQISKIDLNSLTKLIEKLIELQTAADMKPEETNMNIEEAKAA